MTSTTVYPDADPESTSVDGWVRRVSVDEAWATIRAGAGNGNSSLVTNDSYCRLIASTTSNQFAQLLRGILLFDTSAIPADATVNSVVLSLYGTNRTNALGDPTLAVVSSGPASNTATANGDFTSLGTTALGSIAYASWSTAGYNDISLNTSAVTKAGITKLGCRLEWDRANSFGGTWASGAQSALNGYYADNGSNKPKLVVDYTPVGGTRRVMVIS